MFDNQEIARRDLAGSVVIGRAPDCDVAVRDILLSRRHVRIERDHDSDGWIAADMGSKNGTLLNSELLEEPKQLEDADCLQLGRLCVFYNAADLADLGLEPLDAPPLRPADPTEALSGTMAGYQYLEPGELVCELNGPTPQPEPRRPAAYEREDVYSLLNALASSSWDSIYAEAKKPRPAGAIAEAPAERARARRIRPRSPIDLSLQVSDRVEPMPGVSGRAVATRAIQPRRKRWRRPTAAAVMWLLMLLLPLTKFWLDSTGPAAAPAAEARDGAIVTMAPAPPNQAITISPQPAPPDAQWIVAAHTAGTVFSLLP